VFVNKEAEHHVLPVVLILHSTLLPKHQVPLCCWNIRIFSCYWNREESDIPVTREDPDVPATERNLIFQ
jgi:hypothetical protein